MRKLLIGLGVVGIAAVGGTKAYLHFKVKGYADDIVRAAQPFALITYEGVYTALDGSVGVTGLVIRPLGIRDDIRVQELIFHPPNLRFMWSAKELVEARKFPTAMGISVNGLALSTSGPLLELMSEGEDADFGANPVAKYGCGDVTRFGAAELKEMGYDELVTDLHIDYRFFSDGNGATLKMVSDTRDMARVEVETDLDLAGLDGKFDNVDRVRPKVSSLRVNYKDRGYSHRTVAFCAGEIGQPEAAYIDQHVEKVKVALSEIGVQPTEALITAYRQFLAGSGDAKLVLNPERPINPPDLQFYKPSEVVRQLRPELTINGEALVIKPEQVIASAQTAQETESDAKSNLIPVRSLDQHVGDVVIIRLHSGQELLGVVDRMRQDAVMITQRNRRGSLTRPVPLRDIAEVELHAAGR